MKELGRNQYSEPYLFEKIINCLNLSCGALNYLLFVWEGTIEEIVTNLKKIIVSGE